MFAKLKPLLPILALASCGANGQSAAHNDAAPGSLELTSSAFANAQRIPSQFTCDGEGQTPVLKWSEPPAGTKSFALVIDDVDAPGGTFRHWGVFDIPASARTIGGGAKMGIEVTNDFGKPGYGGPCPPKAQTHHYHFKLFALDVDKLGVSPAAKVLDVETAAQKHALAKGELVGTYERK
jgi:Raf kinase inhibitor-like YbhB/YbcL family protein